MEGIPKKYTDLVGQKKLFSGGLFSYKKETPEAEFEILKIRWGSAFIINATELRKTGKSSYKHPTVEYLLKNESMTRSRWTRGFPVREINLNEVD